MSNKLALKIIGGAIALGLSAGAFAGTSDGSTAFLLVTDTTSGAQYLYDTGVAYNALNTITAPINLSTDANFTTFLAAKGTSDVLNWSVLAAASPGLGGNAATVVFTTPNTVTSGNGAVTGATVADTYTQIGTFMLFAPQTTTASTYYTAATVAGDTTSGFAKNYGANFNGDVQVNTTANALSATLDSLKTYSLTSTDSAGSSNASVQYATLGTWSFSTAGLLSYSAVPLPAPLAMLLSALGLMGFVARRKSLAPVDTLTGAAA